MNDRKITNLSKSKKITKKADHSTGTKVVGAIPEPENSITLVRFANIRVRLYSL